MSAFLPACRLPTRTAPAVSALSRSRHARQFSVRTAMAAAPAEVEAPPETAPDIDVQTVELKSSFLKTMQERGFIAQATDIQGLDELMCTESISAYLGFDATADSLHVGSLLQIMILRHLQNAGHKPIVLVGGGTTKVGDPSGKDASRQLLTQEVIDSNLAGISSVFEKFLKFGDGPTDALMVNNDDWLSDLQYLPFLRDFGRFFTINRMLNFESVKQRLDRESPLTFLEFNYMILQAYDFMELSKRHNCQLQFGGSDQWGNIVNGIDLGRRVLDKKLYGLTAPLLTTSDGKKMGKSASGAVWLNKDKLSEYDYWQFWRNTADADVVRFLKIFTELPLDKIEELGAAKGAAINEAKVVLADECVKLLHGEECLVSIKETAKSMFGGKGGGGAASELPTIKVSAEKLADGIPVIDLYLELKFTSSKKEARRLIDGGGARLNDEKIEDTGLVIKADTFEAGKPIKLSFGKKKHGLVQME